MGQGRVFEGFARRRQPRIFRVAGVAADAGKPPFEGAALDELLEDFRDDGAKGAEFGFVGVGIPIHEGGVMAMDALPHWR